MFEKQSKGVHHEKCVYKKRNSKTLAENARKSTVGLSEFNFEPLPESGTLLKFRYITRNLG